MPRFDPVANSPLTFEPVRVQQFPAFALGVEAGRRGGAAPAVFNAANEAAVALFLAGRIRFGEISVAISRRARCPRRRVAAVTREAILAADAAARRTVTERFAMLAILAPILVFGLVIFVHEFGHFLAAKADGRLRAALFDRISVRRSSSSGAAKRNTSSPGSRLAATCAWRRVTTPRRRSSRAETKNRTSRPESDPDFDPNAMIPFGPKPVPENRWFESKPLWARIVIMIAGVCMNALLAIVVGTVLAMHYGQLTSADDGRWPRRCVARRARAVAASPRRHDSRGERHRVDELERGATARFAASDRTRCSSRRSTGRSTCRWAATRTTAQMSPTACSTSCRAVIDSIFAGDPARSRGHAARRLRS